MTDALNSPLLREVLAREDPTLLGSILESGDPTMAGTLSAS